MHPAHRSTAWHDGTPGALSTYYRLARNGRSQWMLKWAFIFLAIAIVAGIFGFTDVEAASATIAQYLFGIFLALFLGVMAIVFVIGAKLTS
jgi:uncharacterized membrane protein YtjA (UPF0391 family)